MLAHLKISFWLLGILALVFLLRLPSFWEPHWYGDEEIYLVLAQMMRRGAILYRDIWDNKTPLLYAIYAISSTLLWAKLSATIGVLGTTLGTYFLAKKIFAKKSVVCCLLPTALVGILLSLTVFEGTIANAELYFTFPIVFGAYFLFTGRLFLFAGVLAAAAFLLKVPAVLDFVGIGLAVAIIRRSLRFALPVALAFAVPVIIMLAYFFVNHALVDFLAAAFSQNAAYVAVDTGPFSKLSNPLFVRGFFLLLSLLVLLVLFLKKKISKELLFLSFWFGFSLYGALLSNRPYMHYLLQIIPPATILIFYLIKNLRKNLIFLVVVLSIMYYVLRGFAGAFALEPISYWQNWFDYISERKSWEKYVSYFDGRTIDFYRAAKFVSHNSNPNDPVFVWGDVASIYVISERPAATKFIQAHHLSTISPTNYEVIMARLEKYQPKYILIARPVGFAFPQLEVFVKKSYREVALFGNLHVYQNMISSSPPRWSPNYY